MATRFLDTFTPATSFGQSLNRLSMSLFGGGPSPTEIEDSASKRALNLAQQRHYEALADKERVETGLRRNQLHNLTAEDDLVQSIAGLDNKLFDAARAADATGDMTPLAKILTSRRRPMPVAPAVAPAVEPMAQDVDLAPAPMEAVRPPGDMGPYIEDYSLPEMGSSFLPPVGATIKTLDPRPLNLVGEAVDPTQREAEFERIAGSIMPLDNPNQPVRTAVLQPSKIIEVPGEDQLSAVAAGNDIIGNRPGSTTMDVAGDGIREVGTAPMNEVRARVPPEEPAGPDADPSDAMRRYRAARAATKTLVRMSPNALTNPSLLNQAYIENYAAQIAQAVASGDMTNETGAQLIALAANKPQFKISAKGQVFNEFTGQAGPTNPMAEAEIRGVDAQARENDAQARKYGLEADQTKREGDAWVAALANPDARAQLGETQAAAKGQGIYGATSDSTYNRITGQRGSPLPRTFAPSSGGGPRSENRQKLTAQEIKMANEQVASYLDQLNEEFSSGFDAEVDTNTRLAVQARVMELMTDPESPYFRNAPGAIEAAVAEIAPDGWDEEGSGSLFETNRVVPKKATKGKPPYEPGKEPGKPASAKNVVTRPSGMTDQQLIEEANKAIKAGKDRAAVMQRLRDMGVRVD